MKNRLNNIKGLITSNESSKVKNTNEPKNKGTNVTIRDFAVSNNLSLKIYKNKNCNYYNDRKVK